MQTLAQVKKVAKVINALFGNDDIHVTVSGKKAYSAGGQINIPMLDFTDPEAVVMTDGYIDHECGHESDSDHSFADLAKERYGVLGKSILNALEDARMEEVRASRFPGSRINLMRTWDLAIKRGLVRNPDDIEELGSLLFSFILNQVRLVVNGYTTYSAKARQLLEEHFEPPFLDDLTSLLDTTLRAKSTSDCFDITVKIVDLIRQEQENRQSQSDDDDESDSDDETEGDSDDNADADSDDETEGDSDDNADADSDDETEGDSDDNADADSDDETEGDSEDNADADSDDETEGDSDDNADADSDDETEGDSEDNADADSDDETEGDSDENADADSNDETEGDSNENADADSNDETEGDSDDEANQKACFIRDANSPIDQLSEEQDYHAEIQTLLNQLAEDYQETDDALSVNFTFADEELNRLRQLDDWKSLAGAFSRTLQRVLIDNSEHLKFSSVHGRQLHDRRLASIACGNDAVFEQKEQFEAPTSSIYLLIDASGSMDGDLMLEANKTAISFAKAFQKLSIDIEVTYFGCRGPSSWSDKLYCAKPYGKKLDPDRFNIEAWGSTPTEDGLMYALLRMVNQSSENKIIFVVTDGDPNNPHLVQKAESLIKQAGITLIPIGLGTDKVLGLSNPVFAKDSEAVNQALKDAIKQKLFA